MVHCLKLQVGMTCYHMIQGIAIFLFKYDNFLNRSLAVPLTP